MKFIVVNKMFLFVGCVLFGIVLFIGFGQQQMNKVYEVVDFVYINIVLVLVVLDDLCKNFLNMWIWVLQYVGNIDDVKFVEIDVDIKKFCEVVGKVFKDYESIFYDQKDKDFFNQEKQLWEEY